MAGWKGTDPEKAQRSLEKVLDNRHNLKDLDKIARKAPLENVRKHAAAYREELEGYVERAEKYPDAEPAEELERRAERIRRKLAAQRAAKNPGGL